MPGGRSTKYQDTFPDTARKLALLGLTDVEVAEFFGVNPDTIYEWDAVHPEFSETRARGKIAADGKVAQSLYRRAIGYHHEDTHVSTYEGEVTLTPIVKHYPPDTQSASLWLRNRQPAKWKDRTEVDLSGDLGIHRVLSESPLTEAEWAAQHGPKAPDETG